MDGFIEGLKEIFRTALMAVIPLVIAGLQSNAIDWKIIAIAGAIAILSGIDKYLHIEEKGWGEGKGLSPV